MCVCVTYIIIYNYSDCPKPSFDDSVTIDPAVQNYTFGITFNMSCSDGYVFSDQKLHDKGSLQVTCLLGGKWSVSRFPSCQREYRVCKRVYSTIISA